ncbi:MAG TPA: ubiquitin-like domain-containing protein [Candidatus Saccharimonadales bacterium]|nr:ubiquitin-like domain-containing protein [Candidatus Saccharimonadales bacterium]
MHIFNKKKKPPVETFLGVRKARPPKVHKHQVLVPLATFLVLGVISCFLFLFYGGTTVEGADVKRVQVYVDGQKRTLPTRAPTVGELLKRIGIQLSKKDIVEPGPNSPIREDDLHINVYRAKPVTVIDSDGTKVSTKIAESTPEHLAEKAGFKLYPEDEAVVAKPDRAINGGIVGELVMIDRAVPVNLNLYGKKAPVRTQAETVGGLLQEKGIYLNYKKKDKVIPSENTPIKRNMKILVLRNGKQVINVEQKIAPPTDTQYDATLDAGTIKVLDPGEPGKRIVTYEVVFKHDKEFSRKIIQSVVVKQPKVRKVIEGTKNTGFGGGFDAALARLRSCEGSYTSNTGNGYYGAYQFSYSSWQSFAPSSYKNTLPSNAPPAVQDLAASNYYQVSGWRPWPTCSITMGLQDIYR